MIKLQVLFLVQCLSGTVPIMFCQCFSVFLLLSSSLSLTPCNKRVISSSSYWSSLAICFTVSLLLLFTIRLYMCHQGLEMSRPMKRVGKQQESEDSRVPLWTLNGRAIPSPLGKHFWDLLLEAIRPKKKTKSILSIVFVLPQATWKEVALQRWWKGLQCQKESAFIPTVWAKYLNLNGPCRYQALLLCKAWKCTLHMPLRRTVFARQIKCYLSILTFICSLAHCIMLAISFPSYPQALDL